MSAGSPGTAFTASQPEADLRREYCRRTVRSSSDNPPTVNFVTCGHTITRRLIGKRNSDERVFCIFVSHFGNGRLTVSGKARQCCQLGRIEPHPRGFVRPLWTRCGGVVTKASHKCGSQSPWLRTESTQDIRRAAAELICDCQAQMLDVCLLITQDDLFPQRHLQRFLRLIVPSVLARAPLQNLATDGVLNVSSLHADGLEHLDNTGVAKYAEEDVFGTSKYRTSPVRLLMSCQQGLPCGITESFEHFAMIAHSARTLSSTIRKSQRDARLA
jgi:hypothetical protein